MLEQLGLTPEAEALARGMLLGDKSALDPSMAQTMRMAGMSHILAVSGLHVGIIMSIVWLLLRPLEWLVLLVAPIRLRVHYVLGSLRRVAVIAVTAFYVWRIGAPPSAVRAAVMLSLCLLGWIIHRPSSTWRCMVFAALVLLAWDPWCIAQPGFQLSFLAVTGILLFQPWLQDHGLPRWLRLILLSVAAQWLTTPVVAYWFHQVPVLGWLQGLLVVPMLPVLVSMFLLGMVCPSWHWLAWPIDALTGWTLWVAQVISRLEQLVLGGHLYLYPAVWEVVVAELLCLSIIIYARISRDTK